MTAMTRIILLPLLVVLAGCNRAPKSDDHSGPAHAEGKGPAAPGEEGRDHGEAEEAPGHAHAAGEAHEEGGEEEDHEEGVVELPESTAVQVELAPVVRAPIAAQRETTGQVDYVQSAVAHVAARVPGRVQRVLAPLGADVRGGQAVAELDSVEIGTAKAAYVQARTREDLARRTYDREKGLHAERISSESEMLSAEAAWQEAHSTTAAAAQALRLYGLDDASIRKLEPGSGSAFIAVTSPIAGRVVEHHATLGELVSPETRLMTIADLSRVWVWIDVPERDVAAVHPDDDVEVTSQAYPQQRFTGKVSYLAPEVHAETRTVRARIEVANDERKLLPGMFVGVRISDPHGAPPGAAGSLVVPAAAVQRDGAESIVFVATAPRRFERREVQVGRSAGDRVEILQGVAEGEQVVVDGAFILKSEAARNELGGGHSH